MSVPPTLRHIIFQLSNSLYSVINLYDTNKTTASNQMNGKRSLRILTVEFFIIITFVI